MKKSNGFSPLIPHRNSPRHRPFTGSSSSMGLLNVKANSLPTSLVAQSPPRKFKISRNGIGPFFHRPEKIETTKKRSPISSIAFTTQSEIFTNGVGGKSFHFARSIPGKSYKEATRLHEEMVDDLVNVKLDDRILDVGCGVGGSMRSIKSRYQSYPLWLLSMQNDIILYLHQQHTNILHVSTD